MAAARSVMSSRSTDLGAKKPAQPLSLAKRLLFPALPHGADLPPLLATPGLPPELHAELYDFVALALRAFVNPWWTKITRYDKDFLVEINRILTQVLRALETRLQATDLAPLILCDIPTLVDQHYKDYRNAASKVDTSYASGKAASLPQLFHQMQPHMAVSSDGQIHSEYVRQAVDHILESCLPPEDYNSEPERYIVREIVLKVLLDSVIPKITQPWFIQKTILDLLGGPVQTHSTGEAKSTPTLLERKFSFQSLIVLFLSAIQTLSGFCLAAIDGYKRLLLLVKVVNLHHQDSQPIAARVPSPPAISPEPTPSLTRSLSASSLMSRTPSDTVPPAQPLQLLAPRYAFTLLLLARTVMSADNRLTSSTIFGVLTAVVVALMTFLDNLLSYILGTYVLSADTVTKAVVIGKRTLFPDGWPAPPPPDPSPEEQVTIRENLIDRLLEKVPGPLAPCLLGPTPAIRRETVAAAIDPVSSRECNVHLIVFILDTVLLAIFPELGVPVP